MPQTVPVTIVQYWLTREAYCSVKEWTFGYQSISTKEWGASIVWSQVSGQDCWYNKCDSVSHDRPTSIHRIDAANPREDSLRTTASKTEVALKYFNTDCLVYRAMKSYASTSVIITARQPLSSFLWVTDFDQLELCDEKRMCGALSDMSDVKSACSHESCSTINGMQP